MVSIDEGDIGKRLDIIGGREKWIINGLNIDKEIIKDILNELKKTIDRADYVIKIMKKYKFSDELCDEVMNNWINLKRFEKEGIDC